VWFSVVTVTTVGYGDYTPVTVYGRITAVLIMLIGLLTLAVVTAQVASNFVAQGPGRSRRRPQPETAPPEVTLAELDRRLARIEELLTVSASSSQRTAKAPGVRGESRTRPSDPSQELGPSRSVRSCSTATAMAVNAETSALMMRRDDQTNDQDDRSGRKDQDHREDVLDVQVESSAAPAQAISWVPSRATNPNHHASRRPFAGSVAPGRSTIATKMTDSTTRRVPCELADGSEKNLTAPATMRALTSRGNNETRLSATRRLAGYRYSIRTSSQFPPSLLPVLRRVSSLNAASRDDRGFAATCELFLRQGVRSDGEESRNLRF
jgi:hypothetical protein